jgi:hypothetical protein
MLCFRDRTYCSALCATTECSRRWTGELQEAADVWWNPKRDPLVTEGAPVAFSNFAPMCQAYRQPSEDEDHRELRPGEVNP